MITGQDVERAVDEMVHALTAVRDKDWHVPAGSLDWDCWETIEHVCDDLFSYAGQLGAKPLDRYVPFGTKERRPGGPDETIYADPDAGVDGLLLALRACGALLAAMVKTSPPDVRAHHGWGVSDPEGFAAMGVVEVLVHMHDIAKGLGIEWSPDADLCRRALARLFPEAPANADPWQTLLWATGRGELPGRERLSSWRWHSAPPARRGSAGDC
jgi:Mycothiol maleylpyruvate isomerase N-terminal domain